MNRTPFRRALAPGRAALAFALTACAAGNEASGETGGSSSSELSGELAGGGNRNKKMFTNPDHDSTEVHLRALRLTVGGQGPSPGSNRGEV